MLTATANREEEASFFFLQPLMPALGRSQQGAPGKVEMWWAESQPQQHKEKNKSVSGTLFHLIESRSAIDPVMDGVKCLRLWTCKYIF